MPERVQRKRTKGWRMPENTIYVGRPTKWGNPYHVRYLGGHRWVVFDGNGNTVGSVFHAAHLARWYAVDLYRQMMEAELKANPAALEGLSGKNLACWCSPDLACHGDVLLSLANQGG